MFTTFKNLVEVRWIKKGEGWKPYSVKNVINLKMWQIFQKIFSPLIWKSCIFGLSEHAFFSQQSLDSSELQKSASLFLIKYDILYNILIKVWEFFSLFHTWLKVVCLFKEIMSFLRLCDVEI